MAGQERTLLLRLLGDTKGIDKAVIGTVGKLDGLAKQGGLVGSVLQGMGQSVGKSFGDMLNPMGLAGKALDAFTGLVGDAADYANAMGAAWRQEQADLAQFHQTLTSSVGGWRMYSAALDKAINAGMDLAFADDEQRASLSRLVTATHDVTKSIRLNRLAMDISRQRHISLEEASQAVTKAAMGQTRALRALGYQITDTKDAAAALVEVQRQAAGAAETYANTANGKLEVALVKIGDKAEDTGKYFQAAGSAQADFMVGALGTTVNTVDLIGLALEKWGIVTVHSVDEQQASYAELGKSWAAWAWGYARVNKQAVQDQAATFAELTRRVDALGNDYAAALTADRGIVSSAAQELAFLVHHPLYKVATGAKALGVLTGKDMAAGLHSKDPDVRQRAGEIRDGIIAKFFTTQDGRSRWYNLGAKMARQIGLGLSNAHLQFTVDVNGNLVWKNVDAQPGQDSGGVIVNGEQGQGTRKKPKHKTKPHHKTTSSGRVPDNNRPSSGTSLLSSSAAMLGPDTSGPTVNQVIHVHVNVAPTADRASIGREIIRAIEAASRQDGGVGLAAALRGTR